MTEDQLNRAIVDHLVGLFGGDADKIQEWLAAPNLHLDYVPPEVWWRDGKAEALLAYLQRVAKRRGLVAAPPVTARDAPFCQSFRVKPPEEVPAWAR